MDYHEIILLYLPLCLLPSPVCRIIMSVGAKSPIPVLSLSPYLHLPLLKSTSWVDVAVFPTPRWARSHLHQCLIDLIMQYMINFTHEVHFDTISPPSDNVTWWGWGGWNAGGYVARVELGKRWVSWREESVKRRVANVLRFNVCLLGGYSECSKDSRSPVTVMRNCNTDPQLWARPKSCLLLLKCVCSLISVFTRLAKKQ